MYKTISSSSSSHDVEQAILEALRGIRYGSVEITIHNSKIVQIDRKEKLRFPTTSNSPVE